MSLRQPGGALRLRASIACAIAAALALAPLYPAQARPTTRERIQLLDQHLQVIHDEARFGRILGGGICFAVGVGFGALALYTNSLPEDNDSFIDDEEVVTVIFGTMGVIFGLTGLIILAFPGDEETLPIAWWDKLDSGAVADEGLVLAGEAALQELADQGRFARYLGAAVFGLFALGGIGAVTSGDAEGVSGGVTNIALWGGLAAWQLFWKSTAEEELDKYERAMGGDLEEDLEVEEDAEADSWRWALTPFATEGGAGLGGLWVF